MYINIFYLIYIIFKYIDYKKKLTDIDHDQLI